MARISVIGRHLDLTDALRAHAEARAEKLVKFYDRIEEIRVIVDGKDSQQAVELVVTSDHGNTWVSEQKGDDAYTCIDRAAERVERQITKHKEKHRNRKHLGRRDDKQTGAAYVDVASGADEVVEQEPDKDEEVDES